MPIQNAQFVAEKIALEIERKVLPRQAIQKAIRCTMDIPGVEGIRVRCFGPLGGAETAHVEQYHEGKAPFQFLRKNIDYGFAEAQTTAGKIGVKCWICRKAE